MDFEEKLTQKMAAYKEAIKLFIPNEPTTTEAKLIDFFVSQFEAAFRLGFSEGLAQATRKEYVSSDVN